MSGQEARPAANSAQGYGEGLPPAGGWKLDMPEPKVEHTHGPFAGPYSSCPACSAATPESRMQAWLDDVQLSNRLGTPHYANPSELKDDLRTLLAELDFYRVRMMVAVSFLDSDTLDTFHEHVAEIDTKHREGTYGR